MDMELCKKCIHSKDAELHRNSVCEVCYQVENAGNRSNNVVENASIVLILQKIYLLINSLIVRRLKSLMIMRGTFQCNILGRII